MVNLGVYGGRHSPVTSLVLPFPFGLLLRLCLLLQPVTHSLGCAAELCVLAALTQYVSLAHLTYINLT